MSAPLNLVFDFGGVLFRWQPHDLLARLLPQRTATPQDTQALIDLFFENYGGDWGEFDRGTVEPPALAERIARRTGLTLDEVHAVIHAVPDELAPIPGTVELLQRLHALGRPLYYLSNMPAPYALHLERTHHFLGLFRGGVFSSRVGLIKPESEIFVHTAQVLGLDPAQTLFIDDVAHNVAAAREVGWQAIRFVDAPSLEAALRDRQLL
jgi:HAD superfamily hydrolase (TIGR01509 family)